MDIIRKLWRNPSAVVGFTILVIIIVIAIIGPFFTQSPYEQNTLSKLLPPSLGHLCGTDEFGRDVMSRLILGARYSLAAGIVAVLLGLFGGLLLGCCSGYYGGILDKIIMTVCDILLAFPSIILAMGIVMVMEPGIFTPMIAVGISSMPVFARLIRAQFMILRESVFIEAVRSSGAGDFRIIFFHLLPNSMGPIIIQATLRIGSSILLAATLSFLGLGVQPPVPEWGAMLNSARAYIWSAAYLAIIPGMAITITVIAVNLLGDSLRDYLDPRTRTQ
jgi:peptide/nickel transport system permease protein